MKTPHVRQPTRSAVLSRALQQRCRQPEGNGLAFDGRSLHRRAFMLVLLYVLLAHEPRPVKPAPTGRPLTRAAIGSKARSFRSLTRRGSTLTTDCDRLHRTRRARGGADECSELESPARAESPRADAAEAADEEALRISAPVSAWIVRRRVPERAGVDVSREGRGEGARRTRAAGDGDALAGVHGCIGCGGGRPEHGQRPLADGAGGAGRGGSTVFAGSVESVS